MWNVPSLVLLPMTTKLCNSLSAPKALTQIPQPAHSLSQTAGVLSTTSCVWMQGLEVFKEEHGRYPDLVVLHSNYWDVAQIVLFREDDGQEHAYGPLMKAWLANAEKVAQFLQVTPVQATHAIVCLALHALSWRSCSYQRKGITSHTCAH